MPTDDSDQPLSDDARKVDDKIRNVVSDLTDFEVRPIRRLASKVRTLSAWQIVVATVLLMVALIVVFGFSLFGSHDDLEHLDEAIDQAGSSDVVASGPLSGTWDMYWTNINGVDGKAYTVRFTTEGTVWILEADAIGHTEYSLNGDRLRFTFTHVVSGSYHEDFPVVDNFEGVVDSAGEIVGEWERGGYECRPDRTPPCELQPSTSFASRLVIQS
jgi:hypothetical protein